MKPCTILAFGSLAIAFLPAALAQDNDAEKTFRDMEKKLRDAKALEVVFTYQLEGKTTKGSLLLTNDNKARLQVRGYYFLGVKDNATFELVSDGKQLKTKGAKLVISMIGRPAVRPGEQTEGETPKKFHALLGATLSRAGIGFTVLELPYLIIGVGADRQMDPDSGASKKTVSHFKAGATEKVGERQAKVIRYQYFDADVTVWIDAETGLPLKRVFVMPKGEKIRFSESYSEIKLDPKVDAKAFELPK